MMSNLLRLLARNGVHSSSGYHLWAYKSTAVKMSCNALRLRHELRITDQTKTIRKAFVQSKIAFLSEIYLWRKEMFGLALYTLLFLPNNLTLVTFRD